MTPGERDMIFELAKAVASLTDAVASMAPDPEVEPLKRHITKARAGIQNFIDLVDAEWVPK
jgi:hypothetical protein